ncbi:MAG: hypothetical protein AMJ43_08975 [Coxiella sp. DG_40]|nr:MAG: hypothetical protein AMJ43_08975 [Coxiella sp. DG_40]
MQQNNWSNGDGYSVFPYKKIGLPLIDKYNSMNHYKQQGRSRYLEIRQYHKLRYAVLGKRCAYVQVT